MYSYMQPLLIKQERVWRIAHVWKNLTRAKQTVAVCGERQHSESFWIIGCLTRFILLLKFFLRAGWLSCETEATEGEDTLLPCGIVLVSVTGE